MRSLVPLLFPLLAAGCDFGTLESLSTDEATVANPEVTVAARGFWTGYSSSEADVAKLTANLETVIAAAGGNQLQIGPLLSGENANVGLDKARDVTVAGGMLVITEIDCTLADVEKLVIATNQNVLYPDTYDAYKRSYRTSHADYLARKTDAVSWETDLTASLISRQYRSILNGGSRFLNGGGPGGRPVILSRTWLTAPATFLKGGEDADFLQDYQIEVYYELPSGKTRHFYGVWRQFRMGSITSDGSLYRSIVLGNLSDFDKHTGKICRDKAPEAMFN